MPTTSLARLPVPMLLLAVTEVAPCPNVTEGITTNLTFVYIFALFCLLMIEACQLQLFTHVKLGYIGAVIAWFHYCTNIDIVAMLVCSTHIVCSTQLSAVIMRNCCDTPADSHCEQSAVLDRTSSQLQPLLIISFSV